MGELNVPVMASVLLAAAIAVVFYAVWTGRPRDYWYSRSVFDPPPSPRPPSPGGSGGPRLSFMSSPTTEDLTAYSHTGPTGATYVGVDESSGQSRTVTLHLFQIDPTRMDEAAKRRFLAEVRATLGIAQPESSFHARQQREIILDSETADT